jgi:hypothetical protein
MSIGTLNVQAVVVVAVMDVPIPTHREKEILIGCDRLKQDLKV